MDDQQERTIYISNLDPKVDEKLLEEIFIQVGPVESISVKEKRVSVSMEGKTPQMRFAFVEFSDIESVLFACEVMDAIELYGKKIRVKPRDNTRQKQIYMEMQRKRRYEERERPSPQQFIQPAKMNQPPPQPPIIQLTNTFATYGERPIPLDDQTGRVQMRASWPPQQPLPIIPPPPVQFQLNQPVLESRRYPPSADQPSTSAAPMWLNDHQQRTQPPVFIPPPPIPPDFYQRRTDTVKNELEMAGGRYRPNKFESQYYTPNQGAANGHYQQRQQQKGQRYSEGKRHNGHGEQQPYNNRNQQQTPRGGRNRYNN